MNERDQQPTQESEEQETASPLRGTLEDNTESSDRAGVHNMGGKIGPAPEAAAATEPGEPGREETSAEQYAISHGAMAQSSAVPDVGRDAADDPAGGDTSRVTSTEAPHPVDSDADRDDRSVGRGADGDTAARDEQQEHGGP